MRVNMSQMWRDASVAQRFSCFLMLTLSVMYAHLFADTVDEGHVRSIFWLSASFLFIGIALVHLAPGTTARERFNVVPMFAHYAIGAFFGGAIICGALALMDSSVISASAP